MAGTRLRYDGITLNNTNEMKGRFFICPSARVDVPKPISDLGLLRVLLVIFHKDGCHFRARELLG